MDVLQELKKASKAPKMSAVKFLKENLDEIRQNSPLSKQQLHQVAELVDKQTKLGHEFDLKAAKVAVKEKKVKLAKAKVPKEVPKADAKPPKAKKKPKAKPKLKKKS